MKRKLRVKQKDHRIFSRMVLMAIWMLSVSMAFAQTSRVSGVVKDQAGEPVIGANVQVKGTTSGSITNIDGQFAFDAPQRGTLVVS